MRPPVASRTVSSVVVSAMDPSRLTSDFRLPTSDFEPGRPGGNRPPSPRFWRPVLCQLSYWPEGGRRDCRLLIADCLLDCRFNHSDHSAICNLKSQSAFSP